MNYSEVSHIGRLNYVNYSGKNRWIVSHPVNFITYKNSVYRLKMVKAIQYALCVSPLNRMKTEILSILIVNI